jgi:hypothetical protein
MIVLCVVDHDDLGAAEVKTVLEEESYPNHCISPHVVAIKTREVQWSDDHPLNRHGSFAAAVAELFVDETGEEVTNG